jgi:hypothetical protein
MSGYSHGMSRSCEWRVADACERFCACTEGTTVTARRKTTVDHTRNLPRIDAPFPRTHTSVTLTLPRSSFYLARPLPLQTQPHVSPADHSPSVAFAPVSNCISFCFRPPARWAPLLQRKLCFYFSKYGYHGSRAHSCTHARCTR